MAATGTLQATLQKLGAPQAQYATDAIINGIELDETVRAGTVLKQIVAGKR